MTRRRYPWAEVAEMAKRADGVWRLHRSLTAVTLDLLHHARRRVPHLQPTDAGHYEFARGNEGVTDLGVTVFDLYVRYCTKGINEHDRSESAQGGRPEVLGDQAPGAEESDAAAHRVA